MKRLRHTGWLILTAGLLCLPAVAARDTEPLFRLSHINGLCRVRLPGATVFQPALDGRAYPYGTTVDIAENASVVIRIGAEDRTTLSAGGRVTVDHAEAPDSAAKMLRLERGSLAYEIPPHMGAANLIRVLTPMAAIENMAGNGTLSLSFDAEQLSLTIAPRSEALNVIGPQFSLPSLAGGNQAQIVMSRDRHYLAVRDLRGSYPLRLHHPEEETEPVSMTPQMVVKFWRRDASAGGRRVVAGLVGNPDGKVVKNFSFIEDREQSPPIEWEFDQQPQPDASRRQGWRRLLFWRS